MSLKHLQFFLTVAETGSITRASELLHISQPAVTRGIHLLEENLGVPLFERLPRAMRLTRFGESYERHTRAVFSQLENAKAELQHLSEIPEQDLVIGAGPSWLTGVLPRVVGEISKRYPTVSIRVRGGYDRQLLDMLDRGEAGFILTETTEIPRSDTYVQEPLIQCDYAVVCREAHPLTKHKGLALRDLMDVPWAIPDQAPHATDRLRGLFMTENLTPPEPSLLSTSFSYIIRVLENSDALAFVVRSSLKQHPCSPIVALDLAYQMPTRRAGIVRRKNAWQSPIELDLIEALRAYCAKDPFQ